jgi:hypothetical protein
MIIPEEIRTIYEGEIITLVDNRRDLPYWQCRREYIGPFQYTTTMRIPAHRFFEEVRPIVRVRAAKINCNAAPESV